MVSQDRASALVSLVNTLHKVTDIVKVTPFILLGLFALCAGLSVIMPKVFVAVVNMVYGTVIASCGLLLVLSKVLKMCIWHKTACVIPSISVVFNIVDRSLFTFTYEEVCCFNILMFTISVAFLTSFITKKS